MTTEELLAQFISKGYTLTFSVPTTVEAYGKHIVHFRNPITEHVVAGYGIDEAAAMSDALLLVK